MAVLPPVTVSPVPTVTFNPSNTVVPSNGGVSFGQMVAGALSQLQGSQQAANAAVQSALTGSGTVTGAMIAMTEAETAINVASAVRNNAIQAYQTILNMPLS